MKKIILYAILLTALAGCQKTFLDKKPNKALLVPTTLADFQALLDNLNVMNVVPGMQIIATDQYYASDAGVHGFSSVAEQNSYIWAPNIFQGTTSSDWNAPYQEVFYANIVLDGLKKVASGSVPQTDYDRVRGSALFFRAIAFYHLTQLFAKPYAASTAGRDPGVPLPLASDVNIRPGRGTVQQTYDRIITDLTAAAPLLPATQPVSSRPSQAAVYALLARVYQTMEIYDKSLSFAGASLALKNTLLDYNTLDTNSSGPFPPDLLGGSSEVIFHAHSLNYSFDYSSQIGIDPALQQSFGRNDLRRRLFFYYAPGFISLNNGYTNAGFFAGIATDEIYLISAEANARLGNTSAAISGLNTLLLTRYKKGTFIPLTAVSADDALSQVLVERRKELLTNQGMLRWSDLRRLNLDRRFAVTLTRVYGGKTYTLPPNDNRYVYPIPDNEISGSGIAQNPR
jgi:hypothetical protein